MRYKEFNRNAVLEKCIPLFWKTGFRGTAISDIVDHTGVNRFSLYEEFGSKEGILLAALKLYKERYTFQHVQILKQNGEPKQLLEKFYLSFLNQEKIEGCFVIHVGTELADEDEDVNQFLTAYMSLIESHIHQLLSQHHSTKSATFYTRQLIGLFYTAMSFCLIQSDKYRIQHIRNNINIILNKQIDHA